MDYKILSALVISAVLLSSCGGSGGGSGGGSDGGSEPAPPPPPPPPPPEIRYSAEIRRTEYGIPHIKAMDWGSLGYGYGYAYSQDNFCVGMREVVLASGRSAELMGEAQGSAESDFLSLYLNGSKEEFRANFFDQLPEYAQELARGTAAGMNRYLEETGVENLPEGDQGCRNADWVSPLDEVDLVLFQSRETLRGSSNNSIFRRAILATRGPDQPLAARSRVAPSGPMVARSDSPAAQSEPQVTRSDSLVARLRQLGRDIQPLDRGSNAIALGRDATRDGSGMLLGNPHQPWQGAGSWFQVHLTIPGEYDVAGATLTGYPFIGIGFNKDLAWTHTVSLANRFSLYELKLNPENPLQYDYDGEWRDIESKTIEIQVLLTDGSLETRNHTFYDSHYGPVINLGGISSLLDGWPLLTGTVLAFRDANLTSGVRGLELWIEKAKAANLDEYIEALSIIGNPVFHDLAADRHGEAFYGEISTIPFVTAEQLDSCVGGLVGPLLANATSNVIITLDGSRAECEWGEDPEAPAGSNVYGASKLPQLRTTDYVANSNNSYWLSNPNMPLEGFPTIMGPVGHEGLQQFLRTRITHLMVAQRKDASDGLDDTALFTLDTLKQLMYANRVYGAEIVLDDVLTICAAIETNEVDSEATRAREACTVLEQWDRKVNLESRGSQVFTEFWKIIRDELGNEYQNIVQSDRFWAVDFDAADPLNTPAGIDTGRDSNHQLVAEALSGAVQALHGANVALDAPLGEVQYLERNQERVPIHGGQGPMGVFGAISDILRDGGYINPRSGNSFIQAVTWNESECPIADVILVPSNSTNPESPHFSDQSKLYSNKEWVRFPFCEDEIEAAQIGETLVIEELEE